MKIAKRAAAVILLSLGTMVSFSQEKDSSMSFLFNCIKSEQEALRREKLMTSMEQKYGSENDPNDLMNYSRSMVAESFAEEGNAIKANEWLDKMKGSSWTDNAKFAVIGSLIEKNKLSEAETLLQPYLSASYVDSKDQSNMFGKPSKKAFEHLYGQLLYKKKEYAKALSYLTPENPSNGKPGRVNAEEMEMYAMALVGAGRNDEATVELRKAILTKGERSEDFNKVAQSFYRKKYGSDAVYTKLVDSASSVKYGEILQQMARYKIDQPAPAFEIKDAKGNAVSLASLKGKTVIMDFWATWCIPCVANFPGMQRAVDYYANDPSVVFMIIHTSERTSTATEDARRLLEGKKYTFNNYMDLRDPVTNKNPLSVAFNINALPTVFVINKEGVIKFKHTGMFPQDEAVDEIRAMVEMANK